MHGQIMNGSDSVVVFGIINITKCFKYMNSCPGLWHALKQWDNLHYHNVLLELFFFFEYTTICKTKRYTWLYWWDLTENNYLCDEINELDWGGGVTWREWKWKYNLLHLVLSTDYRLTKNFGGLHSEKPSEKKTLRSVPTDSNSVIEWSRFFFTWKHA